jgi:hypothetical protein
VIRVWFSLHLPHHTRLFHPFQFIRHNHFSLKINEHDVFVHCIAV